MSVLKRLAAIVWIVGTLGCASGDSGGADGRIRVTTTTGMVAEIARAVGGEEAEVINLMGPGVDPHLYKASEGDIGRLSRADAIFYNGLNLEGKMGDILVKMARQGRVTIAVTESVDESLLREPPEFLGHYDPHVWFDVALWSQCIPAVVAGFSEIRPASRADFEARGEAYRKELMELDAYCRARIAEIPKGQRILITAHDAFGYFGRAYDIEVVGLQGISTSSEYGLKDVQRMVDVITERSLKAVFVESSVPKRSIEAVVAGCRAKGHDVVIGGELFSDALGEPGTPEGTYPGTVRHNVDTIVSALE